jgi:prepilin-type processing-associated H-X9-DG protein
VKLASNGGRSLCTGGITLVEILIVVAVLSLLWALLLPALASSAHTGRRVKCVNNLRQLGLCAAIYADENEAAFPPRGRPFWMEELRPCYQDLSVLECPADAVAASFLTSAVESYMAPRSYFINGWNDYFNERLSADGFKAYMDYSLRAGMPQSEVSQPSETILFGEKLPLSQHIHMDLLQGNGNDLEEVDHARHSRSANYSFVDGSARLLRSGECIAPVNLWALTPAWRQESTSSR